MTNEDKKICPIVLVKNKIQIETIIPTGQVKIQDSMTIPTAGGILSHWYYFVKLLQSQAIHLHVHTLEKFLHRYT